MDQILIVEDEASLRNSLLRCLQTQVGVEVSGVATLREAVASLERTRPNLVVLDIDLPDGSGLELLPELSARDLAIPIVVITAHAKRFQNAFVDQANIEVLSKPFEPVEFQRVVFDRLSRTKIEQAAPAFTVSDYLQLAGMARRSVVLSVREGSQKIGEIVVQDGAPRWAEDQQGVGEAAFRRLALLARGDVRCRPLEAPLTKTNLTGSLEQMLIEAARKADEAKRRGGAVAVGAPESGRTRIQEASPISEAPRNSESTRPTLAPVVQANNAVPTRVPPPPPSAQPRKAPPPKPAGNIGLAGFQLKPSGDEPRPKEKVVTLNKTSKADLNQLLQLDPSIKGAARADQQGSVLESRGELDAETACAVANVALRQIVEATADLGLGRPSAWHVSLGGATWYVAQVRDEIFVARGTLHKNPISTLKKLSKACGAAT